MYDSHVDRNHIRLATKDCPGADCDDDRNTGRLIYWSHSCGSNSYLDRQANIHCYNCDTSYLILKAKFKCKYDNQYKDCDYLKLSRMLSALSCIDEARIQISKFNKRELTQFLNEISDSLFKLRE
jgi:hypothetical protein